MKATYLCLVFLANFCLSTLAAPLSDKATTTEKNENLQEEAKKRGVIYGTALGHTKNNDNNAAKEAAYNKYFGRKREQKRNPFTFGTGMGYSSKSNKKNSDYMDAWNNAYNNLYPQNQNGKRAPDFTFGTALGHSQGGDGGDYANSMNAKFHELFGKRDQADDVIARWETEQD